MGNATSCAPSIISNGGATKILFTDGTLHTVAKPIKAADLMLENSGHFVCDSSTLAVGNRILGLSTDEELHRRRFYFLLPMEMLFSPLTDEEFRSLTYRASKAMKYSNNFAKIFPVFSDFCMFPSESQTVEIPAAVTDLVAGKRYLKQRSWKPALDTIVETPSRH